MRPVSSDPRSPEHAALALTHLHDDTSLQPRALANCDARADDDVWAKDGCRVNRRRGVDEHVAGLDKGMRRRRCQFGRLLRGLRSHSKRLSAV